MNPWASRRKAVFVGVFILILVTISLYIFLKFWYVTPNCFDGKKNGDEVGIDCGGSCALICQDEAKKPIVKWDPRLFEIMPGVWNVLVYVQNPNINFDAIYVPYTITVYGAKNEVVTERKGATILPKNKTVGVFEGTIVSTSTDNKPKRAIFEIEDKISWRKNTAIGESVIINHTPITKIDTSPRIDATVTNRTEKDLKNIEFVVAIFDGADNVVATSRTFVDLIKKNQTKNILFVWPKPFDLGVKYCTKPSQTVLILDRSGSMSLLKSNPPQPLTDAKDAAKSFVSTLGVKDKVSVVSFSDKATEPIDLSLTSDFDLAKQKISSINIFASSTQYTNIYDALRSSWQELISARANPNLSKIIILLTDGVSNNPKNPKSGSTESDDIKYAEDLALKEASNIKLDGITIYTIGLGNNVNESFLRSVASGASNYFKAPNSSDLENIYKNISTNICKEVPAKIDITYKVFDDLI